MKITQQTPHWEKGVFRLFFKGGKDLRFLVYIPQFGLHYDWGHDLEEMAGQNKCYSQ